MADSIALAAAYIKCDVARLQRQPLPQKHQDKPFPDTNVYELFIAMH